MLIRDYVSADARGIRDLILPIQREEFGIDIDFEDQPDLADIEGFYQIGKGGFWIAEDAGKIVGSISVKDIGNSQGALRKMFVAEAYRGAEKGIAKKLLDHLLLQSERCGLREIYLGTTAKFLAAHRFYEKNGFELVEAETLPKAFPRMVVDTRFYKRSLGSASA